MKKPMLATMTVALILVATWFFQGKAKAQVGVCSIPKAWGEVKTTTMYPNITGQLRSVMVLENPSGEIRLVDFGCNPHLTIGRD